MNTNKKSKMLALAMASGVLMPSVSTAVAGISTLAGAAIVADRLNIVNAEDSKSVVENATVTSDIKDNTTINTSAFYNLKFSWDVASDAKAGETTILTIPEKEYFLLKEGAIKDKEGNTIANMTIDGNQSITITYTDYVEKYKNVHVDVESAIFTDTQGEKDEGVKAKLSGNIDGINYDLNKTITVTSADYSPNSGNIESPNIDEDLYSDYHMIYSENTPVINPDQAGKTIRATYTIDPSTQPYAEFDCDRISNMIVRPSIGSSDGDSKIDVTVADCSTTKIDLDLKVPETVGNDFRNIIYLQSFIKVTDKAKTEQHIYPYYVNVDYTMSTDGGPMTYHHVTNGSYIFEKVSGSGVKKAPGEALDDIVTTEYNTPIDFIPTNNDKLSEGATKWTKLELLDENNNPINSSNTTEGVISPDGDEFKYTPADGFIGKSTTPVKYRATDDKGNSIIGNIYVVVNEKDVTPPPTTDPTPTTSSSDTTAPVTTPPATDDSTSTAPTTSSSPSTSTTTSDAITPAPTTTEKTTDPVPTDVTTSTTSTSTNVSTPSTSDGPSTSKESTINSTKTTTSGSDTTTRANNRNSPSDISGVITPSVKPTVDENNGGNVVGPKVQTDYVK